MTPFRYDVSSVRRLPSSRMTDYTASPDWSSLPAPTDDGAAAHLAGMRLPSIPLPATDGRSVDLGAEPGLVVVYAYPRTGVPGRPNPDGWDAIPGARGCTPQSCAFRDHADELGELGARVAGLSAQSLSEQQELAGREHIPYPVIADPELRPGPALGLPTFVF